MVHEPVRERFGRVVWAAALLFSGALGGCSSGPQIIPDTLNPIEWYRDVTGKAAEDDTGAEVNAKNLDSGDQQPYPNLATVPPPPDRATTHVDREKLAKNLIADRQNAKYTDEQLSAGQNLSALPPPPAMDQSPTDAPPIAPSPVASSSTPESVTADASVKTQPLPAAAPPSAPEPLPDTAVLPAKPRRVPPPASASAPASAPAAAAAPKQAKREMPKKGSEPPPHESPLRPQVARSLPEGDALRPPPSLEPGGAVSPQIAAAGPSAAEVASRGNKPGPAVSIEVAEIGFAEGPRRGVILSGDRPQLGEVVKLQRANKGRVRIVGHGGSAGSGDTEQAEFNSFGSALDNAKAVAATLAQMGVPANRISIETAPASDGPDKADVFVEY